MTKPGKSDVLLCDVLTSWITDDHRSGRLSPEQSQELRRYLDCEFERVSAAAYMGGEFPKQVMEAWRSGKLSDAQARELLGP